MHKYLHVYASTGKRDVFPDIFSLSEFFFEGIKRSYF